MACPALLRFGVCLALALAAAATPPDLSPRAAIHSRVLSRTAAWAAKLEEAQAANTPPAELRALAEEIRREAAATARVLLIEERTDEPSRTLRTGPTRRRRWTTMS